MPLRFRRPSQCFALAAGSLLLSCKAADRSHETAAPPALQATARIADTGGGPAYEFTSIAQVLERNDSVFVRQQGIQEIRVFDTTGIHLGTIGREGSGPGEFRSLEAMGFIGDTLWSIDGDLRRLSFFSPNGTLLVTLPYEPVSPAIGDGVQFFYPYFKALLDDGSVLGFGGSAARDIASGKVAASPLLRMARSGATHDTLGWVPIGNAHMIMRSERRTMYRVQPYSDAPLTIYGPEARRVYIVHRPAAARADSEHVTVTALTATGDTAFVTRVGYLPEVLDRTKVGRYIYAIGGNAEAARRSGVKVRWIKWWAFVICSSLAVFSALLSVSRVGTVDATVGRDIVLSGVAAAVVGGVSLFGGKGRLMHAAIGALVIATITNGLALLNLPAGVNLLVTGGVLILAATVDAVSRLRGNGART